MPRRREPSVSGTRNPAAFPGALTDPGQARSSYRIGTWSAVAVVAGYVLIVAVYARTGAPPSTGAAWLTYGAGRRASWWLILTLSVATDLLYLPVAVALYQALALVARSVAAIAAGLLGGFVVLDLAVTWPNYVERPGRAARRLLFTPDGSLRLEPFQTALAGGLGHLGRAGGRHGQGIEYYVTTPRPAEAAAALLAILPRRLRGKVTVKERPVRVADYRTVQAGNSSKRPHPA